MQKPLPIVVRKVEWEMIVAISCLFILLLTLVNTGWIGRRPFSPKTPSIPPTHPLIEAAFQGKRQQLLYSFIDQCRDVQEHILHDPDLTCSIGNEELWEEFLQIMRTLYGSSSSSHDFFTSNSWKTHCKQQLAERDISRPPILCQVVSFLAIPFHLNKEAFIQSSNHRSLLATNPKTKKTSQIPNTKYQIPKTKMKKPKTTIDNSLEGYDLTVVTVYTSYQKKLAKKNTLSTTVKSACYNNLTINILGVGNDDHDIKKGLSFKVPLLKKFLTTLPKNENSEKHLVLFVDGSDVLIQTSKEEIISRFVKTNKRILFSAEHSCFIFKSFPWDMNIGKWLGGCPILSTGRDNTCSNNRYICDELFPSTPFSTQDYSNRWLNSGAFIGYLQDLRSLLNTISLLPDDIIKSWPGADQAIFSQLFLSNYYNIGLDYNSDLFLSFGFIDNVYETYTQRLTSETILIEKSSFNEFTNQTTIEYINAYKKEIPAIIHFNVDGKNMLEYVSRSYMSINMLKCRKAINQFADDT